MKLSYYDYELPESCIAKYPTEVRGCSRLLVLDRKKGTLVDKKYFDMVDFFNEGDVLVINDTEVFKARLRVERSDGAKRELIILEKHQYDDNWFRHRALYRGKLSVGDNLRVGKIELMVEELLGGGVALIKSDRDLLELTKKFGEIPLPPYLRRSVVPDDVKRYQTIWAKSIGSVAAPTASLNMTNEILNKLRDKGVIIENITLHVGLGTFLPIRVDKVEQHKMHEEYFVVPETTIKTIQKAKVEHKKVFALGTTVARTLEYNKIQILQNPPKEIKGEADIFIYPGYQFEVVDNLLTNYHAPKSTVLMLAAAFAGWDKLMPAYQHAIDCGYKFLSYGDSMLIV